jgi:thiol-disulfide isomerase/thioredoxin
MKTIIGKIYANWCGHCKTLKPQWNSMKKMIHNKNIKFVEIEEQQENKLNQFKNQYPSLQINGYPTIFKIYPNKKIEYYNENRMANDMKNWALTNVRQNTNTKRKFRKNRHSKTIKNNTYFSFY